MKTATMWWRCVRCTEQEIGFSDQTDLALHLCQMHLNWFPFRCPICDWLGCTEETAAEHMRLHPELKDFLYRTDETQLQQLVQLIKDGEIDTDIPSRSSASVQPVVCRLCDQSVAFSGRLRHAWNKHLSARFSCSKCSHSTSYGRRSAMRDHIRDKHGGEADLEDNRDTYTVAQIQETMHNCFS